MIAGTFDTASDNRAIEGGTNANTGTEILPEAIRMIYDQATGVIAGVSRTDASVAPIVTERQIVELMKRIKGEQTRAADNPDD
jgi:hypothetical protein